MKGEYILGDRRSVCKVLVGKPEGKRPLEKTRYTWKDNINTDVQDL